MMHRIKQVTPLPDFTLLLAFDNGECKQFDVKPYLDKGVFINLQQYDKFTQVHVRDGTIEWSDEIDLCADMLYEKSIKSNGNKVE
jgi:Protein of unknown function (DUF2442)